MKKGMIIKMSARQKLFIAGVAAAAGLLGGCASKHSSNTRNAAQSGVTYTYHLRGIVKALPLPGELPENVSIKVGPIAHWVGMNGKIEPMMAMTMPYQLAHGITLHDITLGDKVAFTYKVNWTVDRMVITRLNKLPIGAIIKFSSAAGTRTTGPAD